LLLDGRIFGQITQEAQKNCPWHEKIGGRKMQNKLAKSGRKEDEKYLFNYLAGKPYLFDFYFIFINFFSCKRYPKKLFYAAFVKWENFFKFSGYFGRKGFQQSGNSDMYRYLLVK
jgi:hypothetical protein